MSRLNRADISRVLYGSQTVNLIRKGRIQIYPAPDFTEVYLLDDNKMYSVQVTETGDYLLSDDYLVTDTSLYEYLPPYVVVDPDNTRQWILSTQSRHSDMSETTYFMSNSNYNVNDGTARLKVTVQGIQSLALKYGSYSQYNDYINLWRLDYDASSENETTSTGGNSVANTYNTYSSSAPNLTYTYTLDGGEHFFWVTYGKSSSGNSYEDRGYIGIATSLLQDRTVNNVDVYYEIAPDDYFLSGGVYREKLVASDGTDPLPGNVLQSSLSENAETIDVEGTMYEAFYYYVTIKGVQVKTREYVLGEEVTQIPAHFITGNTNAKGFLNLRHKWNNGYKISLYWIMTASINEDMRGFDSGAGQTNHSPLEICAYNNGWYLDFHSPTSTTSNTVSGADYDFRKFASNLTASTNTVYRFDVQISPYSIKHNNTDGTNIQSFSSTNYGSVQSSYNFYDGYYLQNLFVMKAVAVGRIVIRDENDNIIHDYIMTDTGESGNSRYVLKDFIENYSIACSYTGTVTDVMTQNFTPAVL